MKIWLRKPTLAAISFALGASLVAAFPAAAQFVPDTREVFVSWPDLSVESLQDGAEYEVLAVVDTSSAFGATFYIITYTYKGRTFALGTFNCNHTFEVMQTSTNGLYDIVCVQKDMFDELTVFYLKGEPSGNYSANLSK